MTRSRKLWLAAGLGVVALGIAAWAAAPAYYSHRAEQQLRSYLDAHGNPAQIKWASLRAAPWQPTVLTGVTLGWADRVAISIARVEVHDLLDQAEHHRGDVSLHDVRIMDDDVPPPGDPLVAALLPVLTVNTALPPAEIRGKWDYLPKDDKASLGLMVDQPTGFRLSLDLDLSQVNDAAAVFRGDTLRKSTAEGYGLTPDPMLMMPLAQVKVHAVDARFQDQGMVGNLVKLYKRMNFTVLPDGTDPGQQRSALLEQLNQKRVQRCQKSPEMEAFADAAGACHALGEFIAGKAPALALSAKSAAGVTPMSIYETSLKQPTRAFAPLAPVLTN